MVLKYDKYKCIQTSAKCSMKASIAPKYDKSMRPDICKIWSESIDGSGYTVACLTSQVCLLPLHIALFPMSHSQWLAPSSTAKGQTCASLTQSSNSLITAIAGTYAPVPGLPACYDCPTGSYCDHYELNNVTGVIVPVPCPAGYYCPLNTEFSTQYPCPIGTYSDRDSLEEAGAVNLVWSFTMIVLQSSNCIQSSRVLFLLLHLLIQRIGSHLNL